MYNKTMGCLEGLAHGLNVQGQHVFADNSFFSFLSFCLVGTLQHLPHIVFFRDPHFFTDN